MERKYSINDIDRMRQSVRYLCIVPYQSYDPLVMERQIEERLRTYMAAGTTPEELEKAVSEQVQRYQGASGPGGGGARGG